MLVPPSPKFHCHEVGLPVDVSVYCTTCPVVGEAGLYWNDAFKVDAGKTLTVWLTLLEPELFVTVSLTV